MGLSVEDQISRFYSRTLPGDTVFNGTACLEWKGAIDASGYGVLNYKGTNYQSHRFIYTLVNGDPGDLDVDHLCNNRRCQNLEHLKAVTHQENVLRSSGTTAKNARKTQCPRGHEFTPENTRITNHGKSRRCVTCHNATKHIKPKSYQTPT